MFSSRFEVFCDWQCHIVDILDIVSERADNLAICS